MDISATRPSPNVYALQSLCSNQGMGFFNKLGRQVEQFKQSTTEVAQTQAGYQCQTCDERFHTEYDECPECGADGVVLVEPEDELDST